MIATPMSTQRELPELVATLPAGEPGTEIVVSEDAQLLLPLVEARLLDAHRFCDDVVLLTVSTTGVAHVAPRERVRCDRVPALSNGSRFHCVAIRYGFLDDVDVPATLADAWQHGELAFDPRGASYTCGEEDLRIEPRRRGFMSYWRKLLFWEMARRASSLSSHLQLPSARTRTYRIPVNL